MKRPIDVGCPRCDQQPGEPCKPPVDVDTGVHAERIDNANFINGADARLAGNAVPDEQPRDITTEQFDSALLGTGDV